MLEFQIALTEWYNKDGADDFLVFESVGFR